MKRYVRWLSLLSTLLTACEQEIDVDLVPEAPRLVIYCALNPDSLISVWVSQTKLATDTTAIQPVSDAVVLLSEDEQPPQTIEPHNIETGHYRATFAPKTNVTYHLRVQAEGFPSVQATTRTVPPVPIQTVTHAPVPTGLASDCRLDSCVEVYDRYRLAITWTDPASLENYYRIGGESAEVDTLCRLDPVSDECISYVERRSHELRFFTDDPAIGGLRGPNESVYEGLWFSDQRFGGQTYTFRGEAQSVFDNPDQLEVTLMNFHPDMYRYELSKDNQWRDEALQVHQNITGGYGIFSSYSQDTVVVKLK